MKPDTIQSLVETVTERVPSWATCANVYAALLQAAPEEHRASLPRIPVEIPQLATWWKQVLAWIDTMPEQDRKAMMSERVIW